jgi:hypothetical protein
MRAGVSDTGVGKISWVVGCVSGCAQATTDHCPSGRSLFLFCSIDARSFCSALPCLHSLGSYLLLGVVCASAFTALHTPGLTARGYPHVCGPKHETLADRVMLKQSRYGRVFTSLQYLLGYLQLQGTWGIWLLVYSRWRSVFSLWKNTGS